MIELVIPLKGLLGCKRCCFPKRNFSHFREKVKNWDITICVLKKCFHLFHWPKPQQFKCLHCIVDLFLCTVINFFLDVYQKNRTRISTRIWATSILRCLIQSSQNNFSFNYLVWHTILGQNTLLGQYASIIPPFSVNIPKVQSTCNSFSSFLLLLPPEIFDAGTRRHASHVIKDKTDRVCFVISTINIIINSIQKLFYRMHTSSVCRFYGSFTPESLAST